MEKIKLLENTVRGFIKPITGPLLMYSEKIITLGGLCLIWFVATLGLLVVIWISFRIGAEEPLLQIPGLLVAIFSMFVLILLFIAFLTALLISLIRPLFWLRDLLFRILRENTPRYEKEDSWDNEKVQWPAAKWEIDKSRSIAWKYFKRGTWAFTILLISIGIGRSYLKTQYDQLSSGEEIESISNYISADVLFIDFGEIAKELNLGPNTMGSAEVALIIGIPGIFFAIAMRNIIFIAESDMREQIEEETESIIGIIKLIGLLIISSLFVVACYWSLWLEFVSAGG